jgi:hypothetical protein|eukprot:COSAG02_NODE_8757_length_2454_cov_1.956263_3_plen_89_part_00
MGTFATEKVWPLIHACSKQCSMCAFCLPRYETTPVRYVHQYLSRLGRCGVTEKAFKEKMYELWFEPYTRVAKNDSSGFEHVFMGEEVR